MTKNTGIESWMKHPETVLEMHNQLKEKIKVLQEQRDNAYELYSKGCFTQFEDGREYCVMGYAGGGSPGGVLSYVIISQTDEQGITWSCKYEPTENWNSISSLKDG